MKTLTIKYNRKDFFGSSIYTEDTKEGFTKNDLMKAFLSMSKNWDVAIQIDSMCIYWDKMSEFENRMVSVRAYDRHGYTEGKATFEDIKKRFYAKFKSVREAA